MRAEKTKLAELTLCYCVAALQVGGERRFAVASEKEHPCLLFGERGEQIEKIWDGPGGTMSIVQLPLVDGAFLATHRFYSPNNCKEASVVLCRRGESGWTVRTLAELPGVHRFDILCRGGVQYLLACTIKSDYEYKDDWRFPGKVYVCALPGDLLEKPEDYRLPLEPIREGMLKNHGYSRSAVGGVSCGIVTSEEGVFRFTPPASREGAWQVEQLLGEPVSDALLLDFDGDGEEELLALSPFHGETLRVFKRVGGRFEPVFRCERELPFLHAICPAVCGGRALAVVGHRKGERDLLAVSFRDGEYRVEVLDRDVGPANALSYCVDGKTMVLAANRETNEIALYALSDD